MMLKRPLVSSTVALLLLLTCISCVGVDGEPLGAAPAAAPGALSGVETSPPPAPVPTGATMQEALGYAPISTTLFSFTDWTQIRSHLGIADLTSQAPQEEREGFMRAQIDLPVAALFGGRYFRTHAENWGWDALDLLWETNLTLDNGPIVYVLKFRPDFDFEPVIARFREREFTESELDGLQLFSHEVMVSAEWLGTTEFGITNTALDAANGLMMLSIDADSIHAVQEARAAGFTLADWPAFTDIANQLGPAFTAVLMPGPAACGRFSFDAIVRALLGGASVEAVRERLESLPTMGVYEALGLGYQFERVEGSEAAIWSLVMHYPDAALAQADLEPRRRLATEFPSVALENTPYSDLITLVDAEVAGQDLILRLRAVDDHPRRVLEMFFNTDMLFAGCG
jgi:hypothetical protein